VYVECKDDKVAETIVLECAKVVEWHIAYQSRSWCHCDQPW
jgi:hypothetical protein